MQKRHSGFTPRHAFEQKCVVACGGVHRSRARADVAVRGNEKWGGEKKGF